MKSFGRRAGRFAFHPWTRYGFAWCLAVSLASGILYVAWNSCEDPGRRDGNFGHAMIDFAPQWMMGRILQQGNGHRMYVRSQQHEVLTAAFPAADQNPAFASDAAALMILMMGRDATHPDAQMEALASKWLPEPGIGGPLYPPIHACFYSPLALVAPQAAYRACQVFHILLAFASGWAARQLSGGRVWWPVATVFILVFPGFLSSIILGQNAALSLAILMWGWLLAARRRPLVGGSIWGLLAYKPSWAMAFFVVTLFSRRWRMALGMAGTAALLALLTLPVVGWHSWLHWLQVSREAMLIYNLDRHWVHFGRDLSSISRRWLLDFSASGLGRVSYPEIPSAVAWGSWVLVLEFTAALAWLRKEEAARCVTGAPAAFLLLGAFLTCLRFMYYDLLLAALPVFLLLAAPRRFLVPNSWDSARASAAERGDGTDRGGPICGSRRKRVPWPSLCLARRWLLHGVEPALILVLMVSHGVLILSRRFFDTPWDVLCLIALWAWCGWRWYRTREAGPRTDGEPSANGTGREQEVRLAALAGVPPLKA
jgi:arabinofuranan 3-O-arabinosyltransferase